VRLKNVSDTPWFVTVAYMSNDRQVLALNPVALTEPLPPGQEVVLRHKPILIGPPLGVDYLKVFVIEKSAFDPGPFTQRGPLDSRGPALSDTAPAFAEPLLTRGVRVKFVPRKKPERWGTIELPLLINES
jgi:hypothetical protein